MAKRAKTILREWQERPENNYSPRTWVWWKNCWRPVKSHRFLKRGKKVGWVKVELYWPEGKTITVPVTSMKFANATTGQEKSQKSQKSAK